MSKRVSVFIVSILLGIAWSGMAWASEVDALLQKLIEKGVLNSSEAQEIRTETNEEIAKQDKQKQDEFKEIAKGSMPDWIKNTKLTGDFRLRYAYNHVNDASSSDIQRGRIRLRLGLESKINDKLTVAAGLATGIGTPADNPYNATSGTLSRDYARSANQTLTSAFSKKPIQLDYAYIQYTPKTWVNLTGGVFKNPFWDPEGKFVWDDNIRPEGAAVVLNKSFGSLDTFLNTGYLILDQNTGLHSAPMLYAFQPGAKYTLNEQFSLKGAVSFYNWSNVKGRFLQGASYDTSANHAYGNSRDASNNLLYGFNNVIPQIELGVKHPLRALNLDSIGLGFLDVPYFSLFSEYILNTEVPGNKNDNGYVAGFKFGSATIDKWGDWQFQYDYRKIEKDAIPDILPDADFYNSVSGGTTGVHGHRGQILFGLSKNNWLAFNVYRTQAMDTPHQQEVTFYADWNVKF